PQDEVPLEGIGGIFEQTLAMSTARLELGELELERQILLGDEFLITHRDQPLDQILELADITRPPVALEHRERRVRDAADVLVEPHVVAAQKELGELYDVLASVTERGKPDRDHVDPVVEVLAEPPVLHRL